jgi:hypothetical protein
VKSLREAMENEYAIVLNLTILLSPVPVSGSRPGTSAA